MTRYLELSIKEINEKLEDYCEDNRQDRKSWRSLRIS